MMYRREYDYIRTSNNRLLVFEFIHNNPDVSNKEISRKTGIDLRSITNITSDLKKHGLILNFKKDKVSLFFLTENGHNLYNRYILNPPNQYLCTINLYKFNIIKSIEACTNSEIKHDLLVQLDLLNELYLEFQKHKYDVSDMVKEEVTE